MAQTKPRNRRIYLRGIIYSLAPSHAVTLAPSRSVTLAPSYSVTLARDARVHQGRRANAENKNTAPTRGSIHKKSAAEATLSNYINLTKPLSGQYYQ